MDTETREEIELALAGIRAHVEAIGGLLEVAEVEVDFEARVFVRRMDEALSIINGGVEKAQEALGES